jgi:nucleoside-diphosphate-sugar epimerase
MDSRQGSVIVAGAGGFIGGHLVAELVRRGERRVRAVDKKPLDEWHQVHDGVENVVADLSRLDACQRVCAGASRVYQLAADMGGMGFIETHKAACMLSVLTSTHMLVAARDQGVERFFYASSACVYAADKQSDPRVSALREEDAYPALPEDGYGWEKLFSERMCRHFREDFGLETRIARYHNVYGPLGTWEGGREKAPAAICRKVVEALVSGDHSIQIWGHGEQTRSFLYVDDCIEGTLRIADGEEAQPLHLGSSELVTINQLVDVVEQIAGVRLTRYYEPDAPIGVAGRNSDNTRLRAATGWEPSVSLRDGMEKTWKWVHDAYLRRYGGRLGPRAASPRGAHTRKR